MPSACVTAKFLLTDHGATVPVSKSPLMMISLVHVTNGAAEDEVEETTEEDGVTGVADELGEEDVSDDDTLELSTCEDKVLCTTELLVDETDEAMELTTELLADETGEALELTAELLAAKEVEREAVVEVASVEEDLLNVEDIFEELDTRAVEDESLDEDTTGLQSPYPT